MQGIRAIVTPTILCSPNSLRLGLFLGSVKKGGKNGERFQRSMDPEGRMAG